MGKLVFNQTRLRGLAKTGILSSCTELGWSHCCLRKASNRLGLGIHAM